MVNIFRASADQKNRVIWLSVVLLSILISVVAITRVGGMTDGQRHDFSVVIDKVRAGEIVAGDSYAKILSLAKPRLEIVRRRDGVALGFSVYEYGHDRMLVYCIDAHIISLQLYKNPPQTTMDICAIDEQAMMKFIQLWTRRE